MKTLIIICLALSMVPTLADNIKDRAKSKASKYISGAFTGTEIITQLKKSNAPKARESKNAPADIDAKDKQWRAWKKGAAQPQFVKDVLDAQCSQLLAGFNSRYRFATEAFVMNNRGETICASPPTSDYDQGDEEKWFNVFVNGEDPHISEPEKDESSGEFQLQVSYPIKEGTSKLGVITIGVKTK
ncbi:PDC sensor domain-containing protein [Halobacteriovorax sp. HLS]|uniref:PDC sensor domain-containing protein n=1 Tax=Halobacteriovorax sp. HLS TaxID=2234000 RepID=UPI000FD76D57|nr:PDC sensor domain-containing protein [Halobacteriovorax sp. HLS]